jgi:hypothetical protein
MTDTNSQEAVVTPMKELLGKRGFIANDGVTTTVTVIGLDADEKVPGAIEVISDKGERIICNVSEVTFEEPADEPETPPAAAPVPAPAAEAPRAMTIRDTEVSTILDPNTYIQMKALAKDFFDSKVVPSAYTNMLQVLFGIQAGYEMGMQPVEALQSITFVNGNMSVWGKAVPRRLREHGWALDFEEGGEGRDQFCKATIIKGDQIFTDKITFADAEDSGYTKNNNGGLKPGWQPGLNRKLKLRYDVLDVLCKTYVPEVFGGTAGTAEVLQDVDFIEGEVSEPTTVKDKIAAARTKLNTKAKAKDVPDA